MIEIIRKKEDWDELLMNFKFIDFYHTYDYHFISKNDNETPVLITYKEGDITIALPLLIRKIDGTPYFDATSVYGYPGPINNGINDGFDSSSLRKELQSLLLANNLVSVFSRLNPFIPHQEKILKGLGNISLHGKIVNIDLTKDLEAQKLVFQKRLRTYVNASRKQCSLRLANNADDINLFIDMYYENMERVHAHKSYFFKRAYFFDLAKSNDFETDILLAIDNNTNKIIAGAMFIKKNQIVQYHLSGAKQEFLTLNAIKLIIDEMRIRATKQGYTYFNLGGGVGNTEDSLFSFKSNFSNDFRDFNLWKYIVNRDIYDDLVREKRQKVGALYHSNCKKYFPYYRCDV